MDKPTIHCSFLPILMNCGGSWHLPGPPIGEVSPESMSGQIVHAALAAYIQGKPLPQLGKREAIMFAFGRRFWDEHFAQVTGRVSVEGQMEQEFGLAFALRGTADIVLSADERDYIIDWKSGENEPDTEYQTGGYALLATALREERTVQTVVVWLPQQTYFSREWSPDQLDEYQAAIEARLARWDGKLVIGPHCRYCPKFYGCPAQKESLAVTVKMLGDGNGDLDKMMAEFVAGKQPETLAWLYARCASVSRVVDAFKDQLRQRIAREGPIDAGNGYEIRLDERSRDEINPLLAWPAMAARLTDLEIANCVDVRKGSLEEAIKTHADRGQKGKVWAAFLEELDKSGAVTPKPYVVLTRGKKVAVLTKGEGK